MQYGKVGVDSRLLILCNAKVPKKQKRNNKVLIKYLTRLKNKLKSRKETGMFEWAFEKCHFCQPQFGF